MTDQKARFAPIDMLGERVGFLVVVKRVANQSGNIAWECVCDCGYLVTKQGITLRYLRKNGAKPSCGKEGCWVE